MGDYVVLYKMLEFRAKQLIPGFVSLLSFFLFFPQITSLFANALIWNVMHRLFTRESFKITDILKVIVEGKPLILLVDKYDSYALGKQKDNEENRRVL